MEKKIEKPDELAKVLSAAFMPKFKVWMSVDFCGQKIDLTIVSVVDLFLKNVRVYYPEIQERAERLGLKLCPQQLPSYMIKTIKKPIESGLIFATAPIQKWIHYPHNGDLETFWLPAIYGKELGRGVF